MIILGNSNVLLHAYPKVLQMHVSDRSLTHRMCMLACNLRFELPGSSIVPDPKASRFTQGLNLALDPAKRPQSTAQQYRCITASFTASGDLFREETTNISLSQCHMLDTFWTCLNRKKCCIVLMLFSNCCVPQSKLVQIKAIAFQMQALLGEALAAERSRISRFTQLAVFFLSIQQRAPGSASIDGFCLTGQAARLHGFDSFQASLVKDGPLCFVLQVAWSKWLELVKDAQNQNKVSKTPLNHQLALL